VHEHDVGRTAVRDQLHDALRIGVRAEGHVLQQINKLIPDFVNFKF
jgi:hypothetical protein